MIGRILYGAFFAVVIPALLALWAWRLETQVDLPVAHNVWIGSALAGLGLALTAAGMAALWLHGGGLPMNAFPPPRLVQRGIYRVLSQPIYVGFAAACAGVSVLTGSAAGFWVATPLVAGACAALVFGHERHDLMRRFGTLPQPLLAIPGGGPERPDAWEKLSVLVLVLLPWLILYEALARAQPRDVTELFFPFERSWPVLLWTEVPYALTYPFVALAPLIASRRDVLRRFAISGLVATGTGLLAYIAVPVIAPPRPFEGTGLWAELQRLERAGNHNGYVACPAFHATWAFLAAWVYQARWPRWRWAIWLAPTVMAASCITTGMHALLDVAGGLALFALAIWAEQLWQVMLSTIERFADGWRDWRCGPARVINHGAYAGLAAAIGVAMPGLLIGPQALPTLIVIALCSLAGAGLVGQLMVGGPALRRPFSYYGGALGAATGVALAATWGEELWPLAGALAVTAPWVQFAGRFRCLVQGCCHGAPTGQDWGIRYTNPLSRVCRIAHLDGIPIHPTPLYSMLGNVVIGVVLGRMWSAGAPLPMIVGLYLVLAGMARFVEESYRGEPMTPMVCGLRIYQWFAVMSSLAGAVVMSIRTTEVAPAVNPTWQALGAALPVGLATWFAMGVDFPESNRRFSRLT
jgi:membrane-associated phospholipid phosphatase/protein-S-isoprenylcysteine O-methyltransferase Ste14